MERRRFLGSCAALGGSAGLTMLPEALADAPIRAHTRARLVDVHGAPIRVGSLAAETNYIFQYPYAATPCFLLNLGRPVTVPGASNRGTGGVERWQGGVGPARSIVAFAAICTHKLAYPTRDVSFIRYQAQATPTSGGKVIHCCADHSVFDPAGGARVVSGPAPAPLAAIVLDYDATADQLFATGTLGAEPFEAFFAKYDFKLGMEYGPGKARQAVGDRAVVREMTQYCRQTIEC